MLPHPRLLCQSHRDHDADHAVNVLLLEGRIRKCDPTESSSLRFLMRLSHVLFSLWRRRCAHLDVVVGLRVTSAQSPGSSSHDIRANQTLKGNKSYSVRGMQGQCNPERHNGIKNCIEFIIFQRFTLLGENLVTRSTSCFTQVTDVVSLWRLPTIYTGRLPHPARMKNTTHRTAQTFVVISWTASRGKLVSK